MTDDQRQDSTGAYGNTILKTPNMDRIASVIFDSTGTALQDVAVSLRRAVERGTGFEISLN